jgi:hypothetical protein
MLVQIVQNAAVTDLEQNTANADNFHFSLPAQVDNE